MSIQSYQDCIGTGIPENSIDDGMLFFFFFKKRYLPRDIKFFILDLGMTTLEVCSKLINLTKARSYLHEVYWMICNNGKWGVN
jgi:hypothetical protein